MLGGREKVGNLGFGWEEYAFGIGKRKRRRIGFGLHNKEKDEYSHEIYIRELSIVEGGLGSGVWDAAIIMARWIYSNHKMFSGKNILELGSGVGLTGILTGFYSKKTVLTDYIDNVISNLKYNIEVNSNLVDEKTVGGTDEPDDTQQPNWRERRISNYVSAEKLDWTDETTWANAGSDTFDIIIGSELTYSDLFVNELSRVLDHFMGENTIFIEILSKDRDGVSLFLDVITKEYDFEFEAKDIDSRYQGSYNTKQREEEYKMYFFRRKSSNIQFF